MASTWRTRNSCSRRSTKQTHAPRENMAEQVRFEVGRDRCKRVTGGGGIKQVLMIYIRFGPCHLSAVGADVWRNNQCRE